MTQTSHVPPPGKPTALARFTRRVPTGEQRGLSLVEALVAFLVVALGALMLAKAQSRLRWHADDARHRAEALRFAQQDIERQRAYGVLTPLAPDGGFLSYEAIVSATAALPSQPGHNTAYQLQRTVHTQTQLKTVHVDVSWTDRLGLPQSLAFDTVIAAQWPALASALAQPPSGQPTLPVRGRSTQLPPLARDLGDGRSALKPVSTGQAVWLFDNQSGAVIGLCKAKAHLLGGELKAEDLDECAAPPALVLSLSGLVRFSDAAPPQAAQAHDTPLPLSVTVALQGAGYAIAPVCASEAVKEVRIGKAAAARIERVALSATPALFGLASWQDTGDRFTTYHCLVPTRTDAKKLTPHWSGRSAVSSEAFSLGPGEQQRAVCRFSADTDGSGAIDRNEEHPDTYVEVKAPLGQQNFLVVRGDQACPTGASLAAAHRTELHQSGP